MKEYRIIESTYYDDYGIPKKPYWYIQYKVPFFYFWSIWKVVNNSEGWRVRFFELQKAVDFAENILCKDGIWDNSIKFVAYQQKCK